MFNIDTYVARRRALRELVGEGLIVLFGNNEAPYNYPANGYSPMRQDSSFLYFFAHHRDGLVGVIDCESGEDCLFGDDISVEDLVWTGPVESVADIARQSGTSKSCALSKLQDCISDAVKKGRTVHYLPPYRYDTQIFIMDLLGIHPSMQKAKASVKLIKAVVKLRSTKSAEEIALIDAACNVGYEMHTKAMSLCKPGITEKYIAGWVDGTAYSLSQGISFATICSQHGEIMHGSPSMNPLESGRLLLVDAGCELNDYCSDNTRTMPVSGKFTSKQKDIYQIVVDCHDLALSVAKPGVKWMDVHFAVCRLMTERLKALGLKKGNVDDAVAAGAHAMFLPHGLGHKMGMDVHDMEGLGQIYVGFDEETRPNLEQFGTNCLRMGRKLEEGFVVTDEPGIYFIPALIDDWKTQGLHKDFICYDKVDEYRDFGGVRIEDDVLITADGCRFLGDKRIPYQVAEVEAFMEKNK